MRMKKCTTTTTNDDSNQYQTNTMSCKLVSCRNGLESLNGSHRSIVEAIIVIIQFWSSNCVLFVLVLPIIHIRIIFVCVCECVLCMSVCVCVWRNYSLSFIRVIIITVSHSDEFGVSVWVYVMCGHPILDRQVWSAILHFPSFDQVFPHRSPSHRLCAAVISL